MSQLGTTHMEPIEITGIPMPPTDNHLYFNVPGRGRVKSNEHRAYSAWFDRWAYIHIRKIAEIRKAIKASDRLTIDLVFYFRRETLFTKSNGIKRLDVQNRIKCLLDLIANVFHIDDRQFFKVSLEKRVSEEMNVSAIIKFYDENGDKIP